MNDIIDNILDEMSRIEEYFYENYGVVLSEDSPRIVEAPPEYRVGETDSDSRNQKRVFEAPPEYKVPGNISRGPRKDNDLVRHPMQDRREMIVSGIKNFFKGSNLSKRKKDKVDAVLKSVEDGQSVVSMSSFGNNANPKKASKTISKVYNAMRKRDKKPGGEIVEAPPSLRDYEHDRKTLKYDSSKTKTAAKSNYQKIW